MKVTLKTSMELHNKQYEGRNLLPMPIGGW